MDLGEMQRKRPVKRPAGVLRDQVTPGILAAFRGRRGVTGPGTSRRPAVSATSPAPFQGALPAGEQQEPASAPVQRPVRSVLSLRNQKTQSASLAPRARRGRKPPRPRGARREGRGWVLGLRPPLAADAPRHPSLRCPPRRPRGAHCPPTSRRRGAWEAGKAARGAGARRRAAWRALPAPPRASEEGRTRPARGPRHARGLCCWAPLGFELLTLWVPEGRLRPLVLGGPEWGPEGGPSSVPQGAVPSTPLALGAPGSELCPCERCCPAQGRTGLTWAQRQLES